MHMIRDTAATDRLLTTARPMRRRLIVGAIVIAGLVGAAFAMPSLLQAFSANASVSESRLSTAVVERGPFVRDIAAEGKVVAAVSPTLFAPSAGAAALQVHAGDTVKKGQVLAIIDSPDLSAKLAQERSNADAMQATRDLIAVLVELAASVQFCQGDFSRRALGLVLVVHLHAGGDAAAVVHHADGVVGVDGDQNVVAVARQGFVDGVVHHLKNQVVQAGAVGRVTNVHTGALAHGLQAFQNLDRTFAVGFGRTSLVGVDGGLEVGAVRAAFARIDSGVSGVDGRGCVVFFGHGSIHLVGTDISICPSNFQKLQSLE